MADTRQTGRPAAVTQAKRDSYLRYVQIHIELLQDSLTGQDFGCGVGQADLEAIDKRLREIWKIACAAKLGVVEPRPAPVQSATVIPFRPRAAG